MKLVAIICFLLPVLPYSVYGLMPIERLGERFVASALAAREYCKQITRVPERIIDGVKYGIFPDDPLIQEYNYCIWKTTDSIDEDDRLTITFARNLCEAKAMEDLDKYLHCNEHAVQLSTSSVLKIWEMQKCLYKKICEQRFIYV